MSKTTIPSGYRMPLSNNELQRAIELIHQEFQHSLCVRLNLHRVSAPLFVDGRTGLNDDLNGVERPVSFDIPDVGTDGQVVHSLAKWKRLALKRYEFPEGTGLYTNMNAIRRDEEVDNLHSIYVDQWDWEKHISPKDRNVLYLKETVRDIVGAICDTSAALRNAFPALTFKPDRDVYFITTQELEDRWPDKSPKERENLITQEHGCVFLMKIGDKLKSGEPHDGRAPDYDDWQLNGDLLFYNAVLDNALEISSMGIRVDAAALDEQLRKAGCDNRRNLPYHRMLLEGKLPCTIGGGIGQSGPVIIHHRAELHTAQQRDQRPGDVSRAEDHRPLPNGEGERKVGSCQDAALGEGGCTAAAQKGHALAVQQRRGGAVLRRISQPGWAAVSRSSAVSNTLCQRMSSGEMN